MIASLPQRRMNHPPYELTLLKPLRRVGFYPTSLVGRGIRPPRWEVAA